MSAVRPTRTCGSGALAQRAANTAPASRASSALRTAGFTLIEVLAALVVLSILVLFVGRIFTESSRAVSAGTRGAEGTADARTIMDMIVRDLSTAIADSNTTFYLDKAERSVYGGESDRLQFVSLSKQPRYESSRASENRAVLEVRYDTRSETASDLGYSVTWHELMRAERVNVGTVDSPSMRCYLDEADWTLNMHVNHRMLAQHISYFEAVAYKLDASGLPEMVTGDYHSEDHEHRLPVFMDLYLHTLSQEDARRAYVLPAGAARLDFIERHERRYTARVYFANRDGYAVDPR